MSLVIQLRDNRTAFSPREQISGTVSWQFDAPPTSAELRLVWATSGRGRRDLSVVETIPFANPQPTESRAFTFTLPDGPYSFSGKLITLTWALELALDPDSQLVEQEITVGPGGNAVMLSQVARRSS